MIPIKPHEITLEHLYLSRRRFMMGLGTLAAGALALAACGESPPTPPAGEPSPPTPTNEPLPTPTSPAPPSPGQVSQETDELGHPLTDYQVITTYNNYYEFTLSKQKVASLAQDFTTSPWTVEVGGLVNKPGLYDLDDLRQGFSQQERIYRLRCVEAWSMVIPWLGFPLAELLKAVEPTAEAKYVRFETLHDPEQMPNQRRDNFPWPYVEGLRLDEAMHDLALLATGIYGKHLLPQNGAPVRLVVPWKYGFKSIKSIVKIELVAEMPVSLWMATAPQEYGFYANVNPDVPHPRWSQATERRIGGESERRETLLFNGYAEEVASLYEGMDLSTYY